MSHNLKVLREWLSEALEFTLGNPSHARHLPPPIGPQTYSDKPHKFSHFD